jgi:tubulin monoglycylase TTLL15
MAKKVKKTRLQQLRPIFAAIAVVFVGIYISFFFFNLAKNPKTTAKPPKNATTPSSSSLVTSDTPRRPKYWFYMARQYMWIFFSVDNVLQRLGLEKIDMEVKHGEFVHLDWDLLWSYDYHNEIPIDFKRVKYHQRINHIPGNFVLTMKDFFAINTDSRYVPKAFNDTDKLRAYARGHPEKRFVQKLWSNRGITLKRVDEMNFKVFGPGYKYFGQEYVENPLLVDGYKFDFGVYVLVASFDPLRIYIYDKNTLIRLCAEKYDPEDYSNVNSYVISDACTFPWDVEGIARYYNRSYTYKESLNAYLGARGYDYGRIWSQVEDCVREVIAMKEESFKFWVRWWWWWHACELPCQHACHDCFFK